MADFFKFYERGKTKDTLPELVNFEHGVVETLHTARNAVSLNKDDILSRLNLIKNKKQKDCDKEAETLRTLFDLFELTFDQTKNDNGADHGVESYSK